MAGRFVIFVLVIFGVVNHGHSHPSANPRVHIHGGPKPHPADTIVEGSLQDSWDGTSFYAFQGIPYAKAPVGGMRFKDPQPLDDWPHMIDARHEGHDCPNERAVNASEDCLNLNVYSKNISSEANLPVIVFIHPGGFYLGSGRTSFLGPDYFLSKDLVLVTFNYRLGSLGFLNLGSKEIPGNAGLKDQVMALRWVQQHIRNFGGDPKNVTLMGYSAGGFSIPLHLVSPMSRGLFQKAVMMSGAVQPQLIIPQGDQFLLARRQAEVLNCSRPEAAEDVVTCLNRFSGDEIAATLRRMFDFGRDQPIYLWLPVIENDFGQERFLTEDVFSALSEGKWQKVPLLVGFTDGEFCSSPAEIIANQEWKERFFKEFDSLAPIIFMFRGNQNEQNITDALRDHYLGNSSVNSQDFYTMCNLWSDSLIRFGTLRLAEIAKKAGVDVFSYLFTYRGSHSWLNYPTDRPRVEHMDDLKFLFRMDPISFKPQDSEAFMVRLYVDFIYGFVVNGKLYNPDSNVTPGFPHSHAVISRSVEFNDGLSFNGQEFWNQLFPLKSSS